MALSCTMASPIAWEHHYGILLPIFAVLVVAVEPKPLPLGLLAAAYALASVYIPATMLLAPTPFNFAQSYLLFAALIVLGAAALAAVGGRRGVLTRKKGSIAGAQVLRCLKEEGRPRLRTNQQACSETGTSAPSFIGA